MNKLILLVEPNYKAEYVPLSLMKISSWHKLKGDTIHYQKGINHFLSFTPDIIYITSLFSWDYKIVINTINTYKNIFPKADIKVGGICASLLPELIEKETGIKPKIGIWKELELLNPDYSLFPNINYSIANASKGCIRKCLHCMVHRLEPEFFEVKNWYSYIDLSKERIVFFDNNFTACSREHMLSVLDTCRKMNKVIDFNQAVDARLFTEELAIAFSKCKVHPLRFSMDFIGTLEPCVNAIKLAEKYNITDLCIYLLYNFNDTLEDFWTRCNALVQVKADIFPMKYQPLDTLDRDTYIGKAWNKTTLANVREVTSTVFVGGIIGRGVSMKKFHEVFGKNPEEFVKLFSASQEEFSKRVLNIKQTFNKGHMKKYKEQRKLEAFYNEGEIKC